MRNPSIVVDRIINVLEAKMAQEDKHIIKTDTIKRIALGEVVISGNNEDTEWLASVGFGQVIQSRLQKRGYRSVRKGRFVCLNNCEDVEYLHQLLQAADISVEEKDDIRNKIRKIRDAKLSGQIRFDFDGNIISGLFIPLSEEELMEKLEADAV